MNLLSRLFRNAHRPAARRPATRPGVRWRSSLEVLDEREVPSVSSIASNFNGTTIRDGSTIWFNSVMKVSGLGSSPVTIHVDNATISSPAFGADVSVPDATITFSPTATVATTTFDAGSNTWVTTVPMSLGGNTFIAGAAWAPPGGLRGGANPVTWSANFTSDTPGVTVSWQWAAAVYTNFSTDYSALGVKPVDSNSASQYKNSHHAGTPESFSSFVVGGARGGGGSNFTGSYSATKKVITDLTPPPPTTTGQSASLSGWVYVDSDFNSLRDQNEGGLEGILITLSWTDVNGNHMSRTTTTDGDGFYSFTGLEAGTYQLVKTGVAASIDGYADWASNAGTVNGTTRGTALDSNNIVGITLGATDVGANFNFGEVPAT